MHLFRRRGRKAGDVAQQSEQDELQRRVDDLVGEVLASLGFHFGAQVYAEPATVVMYEAELADFYAAVPPRLHPDPRSVEGVASVELWIRIDPAKGVCSLTCSHLFNGDRQEAFPCTPKEFWNSGVERAIQRLVGTFVHSLS